MPATAKVQTAKPTGQIGQRRPVGSQAGVARRERNCSVARTLDIVSDAWAFLIIREAFFGTQTFEAFRSALDIPRATLTDRLKKLTQLAIFRQAATGTSQRKEYRLTKMGFDLYPSFIALMQFGDRWLADGKPAPLTLVHATLRLRQPSIGRLLPLRRRRQCAGREVPGRTGRRPPSREARPQYQTGLGRKPLPAGTTELGFARPADHRRQMEFYGRPRGLLRQSPLRQDPDRALRSRRTS